MSLFLGLDCSTQSLSATLIDFDLKQIVYEASLNFDQYFPHYHTKNGSLKMDNPLVVHSPPLMWVESLDRIFQKMKEDHIEISNILAIGGTAQQHGSVYLKQQAARALINLNPSVSLKDSLQGIFSRPTAPIWMDSSTSTECEEIKQALKQSIIEITGSDIFERFTGPQIRKFHKEEEKAYHETHCIALISSFMASLLAGKIAPIDYADGSGMSLMDIRKKKWDSSLLQATAPDLEKKLPTLAPSCKVIGEISSYFVNKYSANPHTKVLVWSGDNPSSSIGLGMVKEGKAAISLGTSDTFFTSLKKFHIDPRGEGHLFLSPTGDYMPLICYKNGSLAREKLRAMYHLTWDELNESLQKAPIGNNGSIMLPYFEPEIVPRVKKNKVHRFHLNPSDIPANCRALIEAQMLSMKVHSKWINLECNEIYATGGASKNAIILQIMADVFQCPVFRTSSEQNAALGASLCAVYGRFLFLGKKISWEETIAGLTDPVAESVVKPTLGSKEIYNELIKSYESFEQKILREN
ncbi:MAG: Xylulose kinase [Chlamydiae bacterium]|nr:Xylulose kinase [Chlamydiota bacterium]